MVSRNELQNSFSTFGSVRTDFFGKYFKTDVQKPAICCKLSWYKVSAQLLREHLVDFLLISFFWYSLSKYKHCLLALALPCFEGFSLVFLPPQNQTLLNSNSIWKQWAKILSEECATLPILLIYYIYLSFSKGVGNIKKAVSTAP